MGTGTRRKNTDTNDEMLSHTALNETHNSHSRRFKLPHGRKFYLKNGQKANAPPSRALCLFFKCQSENPPYPATLKKIALIEGLAPPRLSFTARLCRRHGQTNVTNVVFSQRRWQRFSPVSLRFARSPSRLSLRTTRSAQDDPVRSGGYGALKRGRTRLVNIIKGACGVCDASYCVPLCV